MFFLICSVAFLLGLSIEADDVDCFFDGDCPAYARCDGGDKCKCKYGGNASIPACNECGTDIECPNYAICNWNLLPYGCSCLFGGAVKFNGTLISCDECYSDDDCLTFARCNVTNKCECMYGGEHLIDGKLSSCDGNLIGVASGVAGTILLVIIIVIIVRRLRRRRLLKAIDRRPLIIAPPELKNEPVVLLSHQPIFTIEQYPKKARTY